MGDHASTRRAASRRQIGVHPLHGFDQQVVWAAGLFEGEGCFQRNQKGASISFGMRLVTTDLDVVERYADVIALVAGRRPSIVPRKRNDPRHKQQFAVTIVGPDAERLYLAIRPWLGERRTARADAIRDEVATYHDPTRRTAVCEGCGRSFTPALGAKVKFCSRICGRRARDAWIRRRSAPRVQDRLW